MPIQIQIDGQRSGPVAICDHCGQRITHTNDGNALWLETSDPQRGRRTEGKIILTHKRCNSAFEQAHRPGERQIWCSNDLDVFMIHLLANVPVDMPSAKQRASLLASID